MIHSIPDPAFENDYKGFPYFVQKNYPQHFGHNRTIYHIVCTYEFVDHTLAAASFQFLLCIERSRAVH